MTPETKPVVPITMSADEVEMREWAASAASEPLAYPKVWHMLRGALGIIDALRARLAEKEERLDQVEAAGRLLVERNTVYFDAARKAQEDLIQAQRDTARLAFYFNARGESRPQEFADLEMRCISDGADSVSLAEWIAAIDKGIAAMQANTKALRTKPGGTDAGLIQAANSQGYEFAREADGHEGEKAVRPDLFEAAMLRGAVGYCRHPKAEEHPPENTTPRADETQGDATQDESVEGEG